MALFAPEYPPYDILLNTIEWRQFRQAVLSRDNERCKGCNKKQSEKLGRDYFRKPTQEEIMESSGYQLIDLLGDGSVMVKMQTARISGIKIDTPTILHVHHKYYVFGNLPWDYNIEALLTVCHDCHVKIHQKEKIPVFSDQNLDVGLNLTTCIRCNGTGFFQQYLHVQNGICFRCLGRKFDEFIQ